jgi:hypothetical protein
MPLFLSEEVYVNVPLESSYETAWNASPEGIRLAVESGVMPEAEEP